MTPRTPLTGALTVVAAFGLLALGASPLRAQATGTVSGSVTEASTKRPLAGAQVYVPGTSLGVVTNNQGRFLLLNVPAGQHEVRVQMIGYGTGSQDVSVTAGQTASVTFELSESAISMDEIVVTGTAGATEKRKIGNTISTINAEQLQATQPIASFDELLQGRAAGVNVMPTSGMLGTGSKIQVRGLVSVSQVNTPLIYVDGVRMDNTKEEGLWFGGQGISRLSDLQANDIERVEVIKGAAATTLYGTEASSGVIQIFTKRGLSGEPQWTFQTEHGVERIPDVLDGTLFDEFTGPGGFRALEAGDAIETGTNHSYDLSVRGGNEGMQYYISGGYSDAGGSIVPDLNTLQQVSARANLTAVPSEKLSINFNSGYVNSSLRLPDGDNSIEGYLTNIFLAVPYTASEERPWGESFTPLTAVRQVDTRQNVHHFTGGLTADYAPTESLRNSLTLGIDLVDSETSKYFPFGYTGSFYGTGRRDNWARTNATVSVDFRTVHSYTFGGGTTLESSIGGQGIFGKDTRVFGQGQEFPAPGVSTVGAASRTTADEERIEEVTAGLFVQESLGLWDRLFITGGLRLDGNSAFGTEFDTQLYPKASVAYNISRESFWPADLIPTMKLRFAWGMSGLAPAQFAADRTYEAVSALAGQPAVTPLNVGDPNLAPEKSREVEVGFDAGFLENRFGLTVTYFDQKTTDALVPVQFPPSNGFLEAQLKNVGTIENRGLETMLNALWFTGETVSFSTDLQMTWQSNEVADMGGAAPILRHVVDSQQVREGYPIDGFWARSFLRWDPTARNHIFSDTLEYQGAASPKWLGSLSGRLTFFNRLTLSGMADWAGGHFRNNATRRFQIQFRTGDEYLALVERPTGAPTAASDSLLNFTSRSGNGTFIEEADFLKLRELSLTYSIPDAWLGGLGMQGASIRVSGRNLHTWTKYSGVDPEVSWDGRDGFNSGGEFFTVPVPRRFTVAFRTSF